MEIGIKIKKIRELKNFTQGYMSEQLGISQGSYSKIENGESDITYSKLKQIADVLSMRLEDIMTFDEKQVFNNYSVAHQFAATIHNHVSDTERALFEQQVQTLQSEVEHLRKVVEQLLNK